MQRRSRAHKSPTVRYKLRSRHGWRTFCTCVRTFPFHMRHGGVCECVFYLLCYLAFSNCRRDRVQASQPLALLCALNILSACACFTPFVTQWQRANTSRVTVPFCDWRTPRIGFLPRFILHLPMSSSWIRRAAAGAERTGGNMLFTLSSHSGNSNESSVCGGGGEPPTHNSAQVTPSLSWGS